MRERTYATIFAILALVLILPFTLASTDTLDKYVDELDHEVARFTCKFHYDGNFTYIIDATPIVELNKEAWGFHTIDDVIVVKVPKEAVNDRISYARGVVRTLYKNGVIRILPGTVFFRIPEDSNVMYLVIPVIHKYRWIDGLSKVIGKSESYTLLVNYSPMDWNFTIRAYNPPCNGIFCRVPLTDKYALWFSDADANPIYDYNKYVAVRDDLYMVVFGGIYDLMYRSGSFRYDTDEYAGPSPLFDRFLADKSETIRNLYSKYLSDQSNISVSALLYKANVECLIELFGNYYYEHPKRSTFAIPITDNIYDVSVVEDSTDLNETWCLDQLSTSTLDDPATGYTAEFVVGKLEEPTKIIHMRESKTSEALCIATNIIEPTEEQQATDVEVVEGTIPIKDPRIEVYSQPRASKEEKAWVRLDIYNPNDFEMEVTVDFRIVGGVPDAEFNTHSTISIPARDMKVVPLRLDYLTAKEANVIATITAVAPRINPDYKFTTEKYVVVRADYYGIESYCLDENRLAKVSDNAVIQVIYCSDVDAKCYELAPTYAECRVNKPYEFEAQLDMMYKEMYGKTDPTKEFILFGGTGASAAILDAFGSVVGAGSIANALRSLTFWQTLVAGLAAVGLAYYLYKSMPNDCRLKPILAVLAPIIGLLGGSTGLLLASGAAWLLCVYGGKRMKY